MSDPFLFIIIALAVYRLSRLISDEEGPWGIFNKIRALPPEQSNLRRGIECIMCVSVWVALPVAISLGVMGFVDLRFTPFVWLALSAVTVLIRKWEQKR